MTTEKEIWIVLDEDDEPIWCAGYPGACHEHINDAINEYQVEGAGKWHVRSAMVSLLPKVPNA